MKCAETGPHPLLAINLLPMISIQNTSGVDWEADSYTSNTYQEVVFSAKALWLEVEDAVILAAVGSSVPLSGRVDEIILLACRSSFCKISSQQLKFLYVIQHKEISNVNIWH